MLARTHADVGQWSIAAAGASYRMVFDAKLETMALIQAKLKASAPSASARFARSLARLLARLRIRRFVWRLMQKENHSLRVEADKANARVTFDESLPAQMDAQAPPPREIGITVAASRHLSRACTGCGRSAST